MPPRGEQRAPLGMRAWVRSVWRGARSPPPPRGSLGGRRSHGEVCASAGKRLLGWVGRAQLRPGGAASGSTRTAAAPGLGAAPAPRGARCVPGYPAHLARRLGRSWSPVGLLEEAMRNARATSRWGKRGAAAGFGGDTVPVVGRGCPSPPAVPFPTGFAPWVPLAPRGRRSPFVLGFWCEEGSAFGTPGFCWQRAAVVYRGWFSSTWGHSGVTGVSWCSSCALLPPVLLAAALSQGSARPLQHRGL